MTRQATNTPPRIAAKWMGNRGAAAGLMIAAAALTGAPAAAQTPSTPTTPTPVTAGVVEWDITDFGSMVPGALAVDDKSDSRKGKVWFVTRVGDTQLYRFIPHTDMKHGHASAVSWQLDAALTGGLRLRHSDDGRFAFVNVASPTSDPTAHALVAIDTKDDSRITWVDRPAADLTQSPSDVSVDTRDGGWNVFTASPAYDPADFPTTVGVIQRLRPGQPQLMNGTWVVPATVTRYPVGGGAGTCDDGTGSAASPCIPGISVDRRRGHPIYFSEPARQAIGELDPTPVRCPWDAYSTCAKVRHWPLPTDLGSPRTIRVDEMGRLWGITSTGSLFSLEFNPHCDTATLNRHTPLVLDPYLFAVAPRSGAVGFTQSNDNTVSVLLPERTNQPVAATIEYVKPITKTIYGNRVCITPVLHDIAPRAGAAQGMTYRTPGDGTYLQTDISTTAATTGSTTPSMSPTGMDGDGTWKSGAFYYGVAVSGGTNRIGHLFVNIDKHKDMECRQGDNDRDHDGIDDANDDDVDGDGIANALDTDNDNDGIPDVIDNDKNGDGIDDSNQAAGNREDQRKDTGTMAPGETREYEMEYDSHSVLISALTQATNITAPLSLQVVDDNGVVILNVPPTLGTAVATIIPALPGVYTIRVTNAGTQSVSYTTTLIRRQALY